MSFNKNDVAKLALLARLAIPDNHPNNHIDKTDLSSADSIADDLSNILKLIAKISSVDTKNVLPMAYPYSMQPHLRADVVTEPNVVAAMQAIAPVNGAKDNLYVVPLVVE